MTEFVVESVLQNLNSLIQEHRPLPVLLRDLRKLADTFTTIKASLQDAEEKQFSDEDIKNWLQKINDAALMMDDIMDESAYREFEFDYRFSEGDLWHKVQSSCLFSCHPKHFVYGFKSGIKMFSISEGLKKIVEEKNKFHLTEAEMNAERTNEVTAGRRTTFFFDDPRVYERKEDKNGLLNDLTSYRIFGRKLETSILLDYLTSYHKGYLRVFTIEGPNGICKTTFAKFIFDHPTVVNHFELRIWVCSFLDFSFKRMMEAIIKSAIGCDCEDLDLELVLNKLLNLLQRKRYLLVLDTDFYPSPESFDDNWRRLKSVLACGKDDAFVLVTNGWTGAETIKPGFLLLGLSDNDCWELFQQQVFEPKENIPFEFETIGKKIVQKCRGMPLAAKVLGGLLQFSRDKKQWLNVMENDIWNLPYDDTVTPALIISYLNLPTRLKKCFAYCALFPKGEIIRKPYLIELWMANGFISSDGKLDAEDVGDEVWNELRRRSFFQDIEKDEFGNITGFKIHDVVLGVATFVAQDVKCLIDDNTVTHSSNRIHHLSDYRWRAEFDSHKLQDTKFLRTYLMSNQCSDLVSPNVLKCQSLRVLQLRLQIELSSLIGDLKHLRYLNLSKGDFTTLPEFLCKLWNLQILKLDYC